MKSNRVNIVLIIIISLSLLITVMNFSLAYFALTPTITNNTAVNVTFQNGVVANFVANSTVDMNVTVSGSNMLDDTVGNLAGSDNKVFNITLQSNTSVRCTYDIYFTWNSNTPNTYTKTSYDGNEFTISGTDGAQTIPEIQVPNYNNYQKLGTFMIKANNSTVTQSWNFNSKFYNINANQDAHADKTYSGIIDIRNADCVSSVVPNTYQEVEYIESDGNEYINTGVLSGSNYLKIDIKYSMSELPASKKYAAIFGGYTGEDYNATRIIYYGGTGTEGTEKIYGYVNNRAGSAAISDTSKRAANTIYYETLEKNGQAITYTSNNFQNSLTKANPVEGTAYSGNIILFDHRVAKSIRSSVKLYRLKIYDNGVLLRNFIPCYRKSDTEIGLYDTVTKTFYTNLDTGTLTKGANVN